MWWRTRAYDHRLWILCLQLSWFRPGQSFSWVDLRLHQLGGALLLPQARAVPQQGTAGTYFQFPECVKEQIAFSITSLLLAGNLFFSGTVHRNSHIIHNPKNCRWSSLWCLLQCRSLRSHTNHWNCAIRPRARKCLSFLAVSADARFVSTSMCQCWCDLRPLAWVDRFTWALASKLWDKRWPPKTEAIRSS